MFRYLTVVLMLAVFVFGLTAEAGNKPAVKPVKVPDEPSILVTNPGNYHGTPAARSVPVVWTPQKMQRGAAVGVKVAATTYDLIMNWSNRQIIAVHTGTGGTPDYVHFAYIKRTGTPTPDDREDHYVVYDVGANQMTDNGPVIPFSTRTTYFPAVATFQGGPADNLVAFGVNATSSSQPLVIGVNTTPNQGDFTLYNAANPGREANIQIDNVNQVIFVSDNNIRAGIRASRSTDYGATWSNVDVWRTTMGADTAVYTISGNATLDFPTMIAPNGTYAIVANMNGVGGALPPIGTGTEANASGTFVFTSTDRGATWTKTKIWSDGRMMQGPGGVTDTDYVLLYGWGVQVGGTFDASSNVHLVFNGTSFHSNGDGTYSLVAQILHWSQATGMKRISDPAISHYPLWDSMNAGNPAAPTNADNLSFPQITASPSGNVLFAVWEQPLGITPTFCDTAAGHARLGLYGAHSLDGGVTWSTPYLVASNATGTIHQAQMNRWMTPTTGGYVAHMVFLNDTANGLSVFTGTGVVPIDYEYLTWTVTGVETIDGAVPAAFRLDQNYPNPFNPSTKIQFAVAKEEHISLKVYNTLGQEVRTLVNEVRRPGTYEVAFDASSLPSGVYFYKLSAGNFLSTKKMVLLK